MMAEKTVSCVTVTVVLDIGKDVGRGVGEEVVEREVEREEVSSREYSEDSVDTISSTAVVILAVLTTTEDLHVVAGPVLEVSSIVTGSESLDSPV